MLKKNFILLFPFLFFLGFNCSTTPFASDICHVTSEICKYSTSICEIYSSQNITSIDSVLIVNQLNQCAQQLLDFEMTLNSLQNNYSPTSENIYRTGLENIRDKLRAIYLRASKFKD
jgi:hypothetical protein